MENRTRSPLRQASEPKTPITPLERIYRELGKFASRKESLLHPSKAEKPLRISKMPDENEVVELIKNWRVGEDTPDHNDNSANKGRQLKKDNVAPEEVVEIIKDYQITNKIKYVQYQESTHNGSLVDKLKEVQDIFNQTLENENRYQDEKKIGEKRPILESPSKWSDLEDKEDEEEDEEEEEEVVEPKASPSKKNNGKKKKKKKNNKKK
ncbi:hypothetical protein RhiirC2_855603 [Rhizophagus irregularis]|uniref:Uncharacterized protein n=1 Tax=Rhizophagus irregularis TaxID=588596 RepID=A0A2N1MLP3_9GLOM|nr:hypothetical protein RhiirC2_855603 [Rhizophagus irregularis]